MTPQARFQILRPHDGAQQLEVVVDADLPPFGPLESQVRSIASIATTHRTLTRLRWNALADRWSIGVFEAAGGVTGV